MVEIIIVYIFALIGVGFVSYTLGYKITTLVMDRIQKSDSKICKTISKEARAMCEEAPEISMDELSALSAKR